MGTTTGSGSTALGAVGSEHAGAHDEIAYGNLAAASHYPLPLVHPSLPMFRKLALNREPVSVALPVN